MKQLYAVYSKAVIPTLGKLLSKDRSAYTYLPQSIKAFPQGEVMQKIIRKAGFSQVSFKRLTLVSVPFISQQNKKSYYEKFGLIGFPLGHSFSKNFFNESFILKTLTQNMSILKFLPLKTFPKYWQPTRIWQD